MTISVKFLVFTLGAIGAIADAHLGTRLSVLMFLLFVALAQVVPFTILALAASSGFPTIGRVNCFARAMLASGCRCVRRRC